MVVRATGFSCHVVVLADEGASFTAGFDGIAYALLD